MGNYPVAGRSETLQQSKGVRLTDRADHHVVKCRQFAERSNNPMGAGKIGAADLMRLQAGGPRSTDR
jgi:hypothetical protein